MLGSVLFDLMSRPDRFKTIDTKPLKPFPPYAVGGITIDPMKKSMDVVARARRIFFGYVEPRYITHMFSHEPVPASLSCSVRSLVLKGTCKEPLPRSKVMKPVSKLVV